MNYSTTEIITQSKELIRKLNISSSIFTQDKFDALSEEDKLTKTEVQKAISLNTPLYTMKYFLTELEEEDFLNSLSRNRNNFQYVPKDKQTPKIISDFLNGASSGDFTGSINLELVTEEMFLSFLSKEGIDTKKVIQTMYSYFYGEITEDMKYDTIHFLQKNIKELDRLMISVYENSNSLETMSFTTGVSPQIIKFLEAFGIDNNVSLSLVPQDQQTKKLVINSLNNDISNIFNANPDFITINDFEEFKKSEFFFNNFSSAQPLLKLLKNKPEFLNKELAKEIFENSRYLFLNICELFAEEFLSDKMIFDIAVAKLEDDYNSYPDNILKGRITADMVDILVHKFGLKIVNDIDNVFIDTDLMKKHVVGVSPHISKIQQDGSYFFEIPKEEQTMELLILAKTDSEYPISDDKVSSNLFNMNSDLITIDDFKSKLWRVMKKETADILMPEYLKEEFKEDLSINLAFSKKIILWEYISPKLIKNEEIIFNMLNCESKSNDMKDGNFTEDLIKFIDEKEAQNLTAKTNVKTNGNNKL